MPYDDQDMEFQLASFFPYMVRIFYRDVSATVKDVYTNLYGLGVNEWRTMSVLHDFEPLSAKEIVSRSSMDKVNVSRSISGLQKRKYLERHIDPTDRRRVLLRLTPAGKQVMRELIPRVQKVERELLKDLTPDERETLIKLMRKVSLNAYAIQPPQPETNENEKVGG